VIYLVRHGQTDANKHCYAGREDVPLNDKGYKQAAALANEFGDKTISRIVCSPLRRAVQTAQPLADSKKVSIQLNPLLVELDFGVLQGQKKAEHRLVLRREHLYQPIKGGESLFDLWQRVGDVSEELKLFMSTSKNVVVVGHYWTNRLLHGRMLGCSLEESVRSRVYRPETGTFVAINL